MARLPAVHDRGGPLAGLIEHVLIGERRHVVHIRIRTSRSLLLNAVLHVNAHFHALGGLTTADGPNGRGRPVVEA